MALTIALLAGLWILLVAGLKAQEMLVGGFAVAAATAFLLMVSRTEPHRLDLRWSDIATVWRVPGEALKDTWVILKVLFKDFSGVKPAGSYYRVSGFQTAKRDPRLIARRVLVTMYTTFTPNAIVIGIDPETSRMLQHQLQRTPTTETARRLGAQS